MKTRKPDPIVKRKTPPSLKEVQEKLQEAVRTGKVMMPKGLAEAFEEKVPDAWDNPQFTQAEITGVAYWSGHTNVDMAGHEHHTPGGMRIFIAWGAKGIGFGEFCIKKFDDGTYEVNTEGMDKSFLLKVLENIVMSAKYDAYTQEMMEKGEKHVEKDKKKVI